MKKYRAKFELLGPWIPSSNNREIVFFFGGGGGAVGVFFYLNPKWSLKNSFSGVKITQILRSWNNPQKGVILYLKLLLHLNRAES